VWIGRGAAHQSPARVHVRLLDPAAAEAVGGRFLAVELRRADGGQLPAPVTVRFDYSGVEQAFGGNFAARLRLSQLPACAITTPAEPTCGTQALLATQRDLAAHLLTAEAIAVPADASVEVATPTTGASDARVASPSPTSASPTRDASAPAAEGLAMRTAASAEPAPSSTTSPAPSDPGASQVLPPPGENVSAGVVAITAGSGSDSGNFTASPLQASGKWQGGSNSGNFGWTYALPVPPAPAGPTPSLALTYSSQAVDGRTSAENGQPSQVGEGWSLSPMFIERRYIACSRDGHAGMEDLCYQNPEYFLSFMGQSSELVRVSPSGNDWRLRDDPTWRIRSFTGASNGDASGDYWDIRTPDGTQYVFGYGREPTTNALTNSAWLVPVFGDDAGEPCYSGTLANAWCTKAWRWNLDRVVDVDSNVMTLFWSKEQNYYSRMGVATAVSQYDRGGTLDWVEYGERSARENWAAPGYVDVQTSHRCLAQVNCGLINSGTNWSNYPDVPGDQFCWSSTNCAGHPTPTFFSTEKVTQFNTYVKNNATTDPAQATYSDVDEVRLYYSFPTNPDGTSPSLFLTDIARDGLVGTRVSLPLVHLGGQALANRVNPGAGETALYHWRVNAIEDELGKTLNITYGQANPCQATLLPIWYSNTTDCFQHTYKNASDAWVTGAFRKYLATQIEEDDTTVASVPSITHTYVYQGTPAWHYDNLLYVPAAQQSWSDWRGYGAVQVTDGELASGSRAITTSRFFRGMNGDKATPTGTARVVNLTDSQSGIFADNDWFAGRPLEVTRYSAAGSDLTATLYRYWAQNTALGPSSPESFQAHNAQYVRTSSVISKIRDTSAAAPTYRLARTDTVYEATYAMPTSVTQLGDTSFNTDDTCTASQYTVNGTAWIVGLPSIVRTYAGSCASGTQIGRTETNYDNQTLGTAPVAGNVTQVTRLIDGASAAISRTEYDLLGRVSATTAPNEVAAPSGSGGAARKTTTVYSPASGYPYDGVTTTNALGHASTTEYSFAWGTPYRLTDANSQVTTLTRDALGRVTAVHQPLDPVGIDSFRYAYTLSQSMPSYIDAQRLRDPSGAYIHTYTYADSFGRTVEVQSASPHEAAGGRLVAQTRYDDKGRKVAESDPIYNSSAPGPASGLLNPASTAIPAEMRFSYDNLGRRTIDAHYAVAIEQWRTTTSYFGWRDEIDYPARATVTRHHDAWGRLTMLVEGLQPTNATTSYAYTRLGDLDTITDDRSNKTQYAYDWLRRRLTVADPDQGSSSITYDRDGNMVKVHDALGQDVFTKYDALDRRIGTGTTIAADDLSTFVYDTLSNGVGRLTSATSIDGGSFTTAVTGYDARGRVTGKTVTIPALPTTTGLDGTYAFGYGYDVANRQTSVAFPAAGGLATETVTASYDALGNPEALVATSGYADRYIDATEYSDGGRLSHRKLGSVGTTTVDRVYSYNDPANRLTGVASTIGGGAPAITPFVVEDLTIGYDAESNVTEVADALTAQRECFRYQDGAGRLTEAFTASGNNCTAADHAFAPDPYHQTYTYNTIGNLTRVRDETAATNRDYTYPPSGVGSVRPHAATSVTRPGGSDSFTYDATGAMASRVVNGTNTSLCWSRWHLLVSIRSGSCTGSVIASYIYDADGTRLIRDQGGVKTLYLDGMEVTAAGGTVTASRYYSGVAVRLGGSGQLKWLLADRQKSTATSVDVTTTPTAASVSRQRYLPFGGHRNTGSLPTDHGFLGKPEDTSSLDYLSARYYDPALGRFVSVDPVTQLTDPQSLNPYSYSLNNPSSLSDPSGLSPACDDAERDCTAVQATYADRRARQSANEVQAEQAAVVLEDGIFDPLDRLRHNAAVYAFAAYLKESRYKGTSAVLWVDHVPGYGAMRFPGNRPDVVVEVDGHYYIWEVKPDSPSGHEQGKSQMKRYLTACTTKFGSGACSAGMSVEEIPGGIPSPIAGELLIVRSALPAEPKGLVFYHAYKPQMPDGEEPVPVPVPVLVWDEAMARWLANLANRLSVTLGASD